MNAHHEALVYFGRPKPHTDLGPYRAQLERLSPDLPALCEAVRGLVLHPFDAALFGATVPPRRDATDGTLRGARAKLDRVLALDRRDLTLAREPERRLSAHCMNFAVLLVALLHARGVPARVRSGFAAYLSPGPQRYNHWIAERWLDEEGRWARTDAQLGPEQRWAWGVAFDPLDIPAGQFATATEVWARCRAGEDDATLYGWDWDDPGAHGWTYLRGQVVHDVAALFGEDTFPACDGWGLKGKAQADLTRDDLAVLDRAAALANSGNAGFWKLEALYRSDPRLRAPNLAPERNE